MTDVVDQDAPRRSLRERERELDERANPLDTATDVTFNEAMALILRGAQMIALFKWRYTAKLTLMLGALAISAMLMPWLPKILVDHVVLARPVEGMKGYPWYMEPLIDAMIGASPMEVLVWIACVGVVMVIVFGGYGEGARKDDVEAGLIQGHDVATSTENAMHGGHSFVGGIYGYCEFKLNMRLTQALNHTLRSHLFSRIAHLSMTRLEDQRIGDSVYRVLYDTPSINTIFYEVFFTPIGSLWTYTVALTSMYSAYPHVPELIWLTALFFPIWLLCTLPFARMVRRRNQASRAAGTITTSTLEEGMDNMLAVQSLGGDRKEKARFDGDSKQSFSRHRIAAFVGIVIGQIGGFVTAVIQTAIFLFVIWHVIFGELTPGDFATLFFYYGWMRGPAMSLAGLWIKLQSNVAGMRRVFSLLDLPLEDDLGRTELPPIRQGVSMRGAGLVYPDGRRALADVSIDANVGQIVAFVGPTGTGKTSLAYLVPRFHVVTEGEVRIDDIKVNDVTLDSLRGQVTYVFQETQLLSDSIADNIRYGNPGASDEEVERVARVAGVHGFIASLPEGYDTKLGTTSAKLSVGQKQRVAIARGLLRDARILILDEPTSALDPETEEHLVRSLHEAAKDRLVIIIAHRLSTIANADKIVFLEGGRVMEQGSHEELMATDGGRYRAFVELQTMSS